jgi:hypothetical protein
MLRLVPQTKSTGEPRMSASGWWIVLLAVATAVDGLLAGASLDQSIKQLPARHRIGVVAYSAYSQAADLGNGVVWYAALGIGGALLTVASATLALMLIAPEQTQRLLLIAGVLAIAHWITTARAAPLNFSQRAAQARRTRCVRSSRASSGCKRSVPSCSSPPSPSWSGRWRRLLHGYFVR